MDSFCTENKLNWYVSLFSMTLKVQSANPTPETGYGLDETYYTDLLKMKLDNAV